MKTKGVIGFALTEKYLEEKVMEFGAGVRKLTWTVLAVCGLLLAGQAFAADLRGQVMGGGAPIAQSTVTLWAASSDVPKQLAQTKTDNEGRFEVSTAGAPADSSLYLTAVGGIPARNKAGGNNPAITLLAVVGGKPPARVVINEFTTIASVWTHAQLHRRHDYQGRTTAVAHCGGQCAQLR